MSFFSAKQFDNSNKQFGRFIDPDTMNAPPEERTGGMQDLLLDPYCIGPSSVKPSMS